MENPEPTRGTSEYEQELHGWRRWRLQEDHSSALNAVETVEIVETKPPHLKGRVGHTATYVPSLNQVLLVGGANPEEVFAEVWRLDLASWQLILDESTGQDHLPPRYEHATWLEEGVSLKGVSEPKICVWGGANMDGNKADLWTYSVNGKKWQSIRQENSIPTERTAHSNSFYNRKQKELFLLGGGSRGHEPISDVQLYVLDSSRQWRIESTCGEAPTPRQGHILLAKHNKVYCHGGLANHTFLDDMCILDLGSGVWNRIETSPKPCGRASHGAVIHDSKLYLFGGFGTEGSLNDLWQFDLEYLEWTKIETVGLECPAPRLDFAFTFCELKNNSNEYCDESDNKANDKIPCLLIHGGMDAMGCIHNDCYTIRIG